MTRLLGIDLGDRRIGIALGDTESGLARPLVTIARRDIDSDRNALLRLAHEHDVSEVVVGLPLHADGSEGQQAATTRAWAAAIERETGLRVTWRDERYTSQDAEHRIGAPRRGRAGGAPSAVAMRSWRARVDREAAASILQAELDERQGLEGRPATTEPTTPIDTTTTPRATEARA